MENIMTNKITVTIEVEVDQDWIDYCTQENDLFMTDHCGYWMAGMEHDEVLGWLCYEHDYPGGFQGDHNPSPRHMKRSPEYAAIVQAWKDGKPLPDRFYRLNRDASIRAYKFGIEKDGTGWYENGDALTYDYAVQMALLGHYTYA
jgi:hypothetical protein